jgi:hypothetical protein
MNYSLFFRTDASILCLLLLIGCILMVVFGKFVRTRFLHSDETESRGGVNSLLGALFGLWGFILAFTFGNSASRFENVRSVMVDEANIIRNTIFRADPFPDSIRNGLRVDLQKYLNARIDYYKYVKDFDKFKQAKADADNAAQSLWRRAVRAASLPNMVPPSNNMMASLTSMYDVAAKRDALLAAGVPELIIYMLFFLALTISFIGGFTTPVIKQKEWIVITGFVLLAATIIYITLDLGRPLRGLIKPHMGEDKVVELRKYFS